MSSPSVRVFHGTTAAAAERIRQEGWVDTNLATAAQSLCESYDVDFASTWELIPSHLAFIKTADRDGWVSFTSTQHEATAWAHRGPEWRREALRAIWCSLHQRDWSQFSADGERWRDAQSPSDPPVIIEAELERDLLFLRAQGNRPPRPLTQKYLDDLAAIRSTPQRAGVRSGVNTEYRARAPVQPECIIAIHRVGGAVDAMNE